MARIREYTINLHEGTAIGPFLLRLEGDLDRSRNVRGLPEELTRAMLAHLGHSEDFDDDIESVVAL